MADTRSVIMMAGLIILGMAALILGGAALAGDHIVLALLALALGAGTLAILYAGLVAMAKLEDPK